MNQVTRQTETQDTRLENNQAKRIVGVVFGVIEIILGLRLIFKLLGANPDNGFIKIIYNITQFFVGIFEGIFAKISLNDAGLAVFEPATLIAIILVALIAWLVLKLMSPRISNRVERTEYIQPDNSDNRQHSESDQNNRR
ncbi:MAG: YggT family protein [Ruminococcaceae bacterium]|nr:YggT family protein [Oscillospiraceae bacterium]